ncbi:hypothetical protein VP14_101 [Vibrio phage VPMCC14]|nr:hypothetical protein VP14_101 [Vibrio phage VPMCC14]
MCWCNHNLRTPCCGGVDCHPPETKGKNEILQNSQLQLWQSYCDKKQECETIKDLLEDCLSVMSVGDIQQRTEIAVKVYEYLYTTSHTEKSLDDILEDSIETIDSSITTLKYCGDCQDTIKHLYLAKKSIQNRLEK